MSSIKKLIPLSLRRAIIRPIRREIGSFLVDCGYVILGEKDELTPPTRKTFNVSQDFRAVGYEFLRFFTEFGRLQPHERVLDIGCGIGRMARPLTNFLKEGTYEGTDIVSKGIDWCKTHITPKYPNFHFQLADIYNKYYNPCGKCKASEYTFPFEDESFDFIFLTSVFTHILLEDVEHYFAEVSRMLEKKGRVFSTWFLLNDESSRLISEDKDVPQILHKVANSDKCLALYPDVPEELVGYDETYVQTIFKHYGLVINYPIRYGSWCKRPDFTSFQDIIVAEKG